MFFDFLSTIKVDDVDQVSGIEVIDLSIMAILHCRLFSHLLTEKIGLGFFL